MGFHPSAARAHLNLPAPVKMFITKQILNLITRSSWGAPALPGGPRLLPSLRAGPRWAPAHVGSVTPVAPRGGRLGIGGSRFGGLRPP